jgi:para-aminobenzoate synthetase/4-amino-4-deoxychorismate lyase
MFGARFDDLTDGLSYAFRSPLREIVATRIDEVVDAVVDASRTAKDGYWVAGYVAYEAAPAFDDALVVGEHTDGPLAWFGVFKDRVSVDAPGIDTTSVKGFSVSRWAPGWERDQYDRAFLALRDRIEVGDTYQVNLTFPMHAAFSGETRIMYADLVAAQRPRYAAHLWHGHKHVVSVSPEQFFAINNGRITTRPMKGTARRGRWLIEDEAVRKELNDSEKDRSENLMIVDLLRNDLGRVGEFGSVSVDELFTMEKYQTVWQMTSEISATLRRETGLVDVFRALFPCGSVTGAPKARSMEIIAELESAPRGVYCGAIGFIPPGDGVEGASFNVAIRTAVIDEAEGIASYGVGGGITWDSTSGSEHDEALAKARVLTARPASVELIETIRWDDEFVMLDEHLERLSDSAKYWGMPCEADSLRPLLADLESTMIGPTMVRVLASGGGNVSLSLSEAPARFALGPRPSGDSVVVCVDRNPLDSSDPRLFHKVADRKHFDERRKRHVAFEDVLCVNEKGNITESTIANVAFLIDGVWLTPPVTDGLLNGVMRERLISDGTVKERSVSISEALEAEAVALLSSVRGWRPAVIDPSHVQTHNFRGVGATGGSV